MKDNDLKITLTLKEAQYASILCVGFFEKEGSDRCAAEDRLVPYHPHFRTWIISYFPCLLQPSPKGLEPRFGLLCTAIAAHLDPDVETAESMLSEAEAEHLFILCLGAVDHGRDETTLYNPHFNTWSNNLRRIIRPHEQEGGTEQYKEVPRQYFGRLCTAIAAHLDPDVEDKIK